MELTQTLPTLEVPASNQGKQEGYPYSYNEGIRDKFAPMRFGLAAEVIIDSLGITNEGTCIELGGGPGLLSSAIQSKMNSVKFFNLELDWRALSRSKEEGLSGVRTNLEESLPISSNSVDFVISTDVLEHLDAGVKVLEEVYRILKPGGKAFLVIADPSEGRFFCISDHIQRDKERGTDVIFWEKEIERIGFEIDSEKSEKTRKRDWRRILNVPILRNLKDKPLFACAFVPVYRPGVYILEKLLS